MLLVLRADTGLACSTWRHDKFAFGRADGAFRRHRYHISKAFDVRDFGLFPLIYSIMDNPSAYRLKLFWALEYLVPASTYSTIHHNGTSEALSCRTVIWRWIVSQPEPLQLSMQAPACRTCCGGEGYNPPRAVENHYLCYWNHNEASAIAGKSYRQRRCTRSVFSPHPRARSATTINLHCVASSSRQTVGLECLCCC